MVISAMIEKTILLQYQQRINSIRSQNLQQQQRKAPMVVQQQGCNSNKIRIIHLQRKFIQKLHVVFHPIIFTYNTCSSKALISCYKNRNMNVPKQERGGSTLWSLLYIRQVPSCDTNNIVLLSHIGKFYTLYNLFYFTLYFHH